MGGADNAAVTPTAPAPAAPMDALADTTASGELALTLLSAGYHLRMINAIRARFDGQAERVVLPVLLWLAAQRHDPCPEVASAAAAILPVSCSSAASSSSSQSAWDQPTVAASSRAKAAIRQRWRPASGSL
jgi:hypothetical protein